MRRLAAALLVLLTTGCSFSQVDPDARVEVTGRVLDASGRPLAGARVLLLKQADLGEVVFGSVLAIGTLSTICYLPDPPALCRSAVRATADADGRYAFHLDGADTQGTLGTASTMNVVFSAATGAASTTVGFTVAKEEVRLPDARLWQSRVRVAADRSGIRLRWSRLPGGGASYTAQAYGRDAPAALWSQPARGLRAGIDPRLLESRAGAVAVGAQQPLRGASGARTVVAHYLSRRVPVHVPVGTPASRGRPCAPVTGTAPVEHDRFSRCAATDGDLTAPAHLTARGQAVVTGVVVDLGRSRPVDLVVARGFAGQVLVELSADGTTYATRATASGTTAIPVPGRPSARYVRLRSPAGLDESLSSEISVW